MTDINYAAQAILARRDHSEAEIRAKLKRKKFAPAQIDTTINKLTKLGLINDQSFTATYINSTLNYKAVGPKWLAYKLKQKGIAQTIIDQAIADIFTDQKEHELAQQAADSWRRTHPRHTGDRQRLTRHLISRGFSYQTVNSYLAS